MRRAFQVLALGAATLVATAASPGIAAADQGLGRHLGNAPLEKPVYTSERAHGYGQDRGKHPVSEKRRRHHSREHRHYGHGHHTLWRHRHGHRRYYGWWRYRRVYSYRSFDPPPPVYLPPPPAYPVQPAMATQPATEAGPPSTCLMTREFQTEVLVGGELVPAYGRACLQPDGSWYRGPAVPEHY